jgi:hypothetical protein
MGMKGKDRGGIALMPDPRNGPMKREKEETVQGMKVTATKM